MTAMTTMRPRLDGWTVDDLYEMPDDGMRYEIIDGSLLVSPPEAIPNRLGAHRLCNLLQPALGDDWLAVPGGCGVNVDARSFCEPDVVVLARSAYREGLLAAADALLLFEAMSPSSRTTDRVTKPAKYAEAGIPHYWRLERHPALILFTYVLDGETYRETGRFTDEVVIDEPVSLRFSLPDLLA